MLVMVCSLVSRQICGIAEILIMTVNLILKIKSMISFLYGRVTSSIRLTG